MSRWIFLLWKRDRLTLDNFQFRNSISHCMLVSVANSRKSREKEEEEKRQFHKWTSGQEAANTLGLSWEKSGVQLIHSQKTNRCDVNTKALQILPKVNFLWNGWNTTFALNLRHLGMTDYLEKASQMSIWREFVQHYWNIFQQGLTWALSRIVGRNPLGIRANQMTAQHTLFLWSQSRPTKASRKQPSENHLWVNAPQEKRIRNVCNETSTFFVIDIV